jgi:hypothetical protein
LGAGCRAAGPQEGRGSGGEGRVVAQRGKREVEEDMSDRSAESKRVHDGLFDGEKSSAQSEIAKELVVRGQNVGAKTYIAAR